MKNFSYSSDQTSTLESPYDLCWYNVVLGSWKILNILQNSLNQPFLLAINTFWPRRDHTHHP